MAAATAFSRKKPARGLSGDTFESIFHHRDGGSTSGESSTEDAQQLPQPTSRRGGKRGGKKGSASLGDFVEEMNSSFQGGITDACEQTVDSREISRFKVGDGPLRQPVRRTRSGRKPIKEES